MTASRLPIHRPVGPVPHERPVRTGQWRVLSVVAAGAMLGASGRHALELAWPTQATAFPWATFVTNTSGCLLIGVLMVQVVELGMGHPLLRPFLGVGLLGGYTTVSTYAVQTQQLLGRHPWTAGTYLIGTVVAAFVGVTVGVVAARGAHRLKQRHSHPRKSSR